MPDNATNYLEEGLDENRIYVDDSSDSSVVDLETLAKPYIAIDTGLKDSHNRSIKATAAPLNAHGSVPHGQQGILISAAPSYISVKGRPLDDNDKINFDDSNTDIKAGGTSNVGKTVAIASIKTSYEVITNNQITTVTENYALDLTTPATTYATVSGKKYLPIDTLPGSDWLSVQGKLAQKSDGATENDLTSTAYYVANAGTIDSLELDKSSNLNSTTYEPGALKFTTKGTATITISFITNGGNAGAYNEVKLAVGTYTIADNKPTYTYLTADTATNCTGTDGIYTYDVSMTSKNVATVTYTIAEAGTYYILNPGARAVRIKDITMSDSYKAVANTIVTSTSNATLNFVDTSTADTTIFDFSGATIATSVNDEGKDYASRKVIGDIKVNVKKGAVVYVVGYYNQSESTVNYTFTANGETTDALHTNSYIVATEDQTITITGSGNNYLQAIYVLYPLDEASSIIFDAKATDATYPEGKVLQYSGYLVNDILVDTCASGNTAKVSSRVNENWGQFTTGSKVLVVLQKGQTVSATTYNGDATMTVSVLGGEQTTVANAGAQAATTYTATADNTVVIITSISNDYIRSIVVTE